MGMMKSDRGFNQLKGKTIKRVVATAINAVKIVCTDDTEYEVNADEQFLSIAIVTLVQVSPSLKDQKHD